MAQTQKPQVAGKRAVLEVQESFQVEDGMHTGEIMEAVLRETEEGYGYVDIAIKLDPDGPTIRDSYPARITINSALGQLAARFGLVNFDKHKPGTSVDLDKLKGKKVSFLTVNETNERGTFARIVRNPPSLKPANDLL